MHSRFLVAFRADADSVIGGGHVMRSLALATEFCSRGHEVIFFCTPDTIRTAPALARSGFDLVDVEIKGSLSSAILLESKPQGFDALVIDSYAISAAAEDEVQNGGAVSLVLSFEDLPIRPHCCDILIDSVLGRERADYEGYIKDGCVTLLGPSYVPLRSEFRSFRTAALERRHRDSLIVEGKPFRVLVSFGLADPGDVTLQVVAAICSIGEDVAVDVVIGGNTKALAALDTLALRHQHLSVHVDPPSMAQLMTLADLAVGAGGSTSWERCCLGLPSLVIVLADNQANIAARLSSAGAAITVPETWHPALVANLVTDLLRDSERRAEMASRSAALCDGGGAERIARCVETLLMGG